MKVLDLLLRQAAESQEPNPDSLSAGFQALEYLFKFMVQSRMLYSRATCGMEEEQFRSSIQDLFQSVRLVLSLDSRSSEMLLFTQVRTGGSSSSSCVQV